jgi:hypothetical protein
MQSITGYCGWYQTEFVSTERLPQFLSNRLWAVKFIPQRALLREIPSYWTAF